jgi:hypothetical protein
VTEWSAYLEPPGMVLGFHGTEDLTADAVVNQKVRHLTPSQQTHDWLGHGVYFWENDPQRAAFPESEPLYEGAGFRKKNHIQICIRNATKCIKGYFKPIRAQ